MKSILLLICSLISTGSVSAQWLPLNTNNTNPITGVKFVNSQTGFACGVYGTLLRTQNGGASWQPLNAGTTYSLMSVDAIDELHVFTARVGIYRTVNGSTFSEVGGLSNYFGTIFAIKFRDANNGFVIKAGDIFKTTDGGNSWTGVYHSGGYINQLEFTSPQVAYAAGGITYDGVNSGEIHKTVDSGNTWQNLHLAADNVTAMHFLNDTAGYIFTFPQGVYKTINGGQSWSSVSGNLTHNVSSIVFADAQTAYAAAGGAIYKTTDGCISWLKEYESTDTLVGIIQQSPDGSLFAGCNNGVILRKVVRFP